MTFAVLLIAFLATGIRADELLDRVALAGESTNAGRQLDSARKLAAAKKWADAIAEYQSLIENSGDELAPLDPQHAVGLRWLCHWDLARLPFEARKLYRERVEVQAARWLEEGAGKHDERLLKRVVDEAFGSAAAAKALDALGNLAFERGEFQEARRWWQMLAGPLTSPKDPPPLQLAYAGAPPEELAAARAKLVLALLFLGERELFQKELEAFAALHPRAEGSLAGHKGPYAETLKALAQPDFHPPGIADGWTTFAGDPARQRTSAGDTHRLARMCKDGPRWRFEMRRTPGEERKRARMVVTGASLPFHPVILGDNVLVADGRYITAYGIRTGESQIWYDLQKDMRISVPELQLPAEPYLRFTLSAAEGHVVARLGAQAIGGENVGSAGLRDTYLVCLREKPNRKGERLCWTVRAAKPEAKTVDVFFEGTPIVHDGRVYAVCVSYSGNQSTTQVQCYALDADSESPVPPLLLWMQELCTIKEDVATARYRHHLLTLAGRNIVYASHSGAIMAIDALTGKHAWSRRYKSRGPNIAPDRPARRDLAPCLYSDGRVYVAPQDDNHLLCLDAATGSQVWSKSELEVVQLLGIVRGRLVFTVAVMSSSSPGETGETQMRAIDAATGSATAGWFQPADGRGVPSFGRGIFFGDQVLWPTEQGVCVVNQDDGQPVYEPVIESIQRGNMAYDNGCLAVAGVHELILYVSGARQRGEREAEVRLHPNSPQALERLAEAHADSGAWQEAYETCKRASDAAGKLTGAKRDAFLAANLALMHESLLGLVQTAQGRGDHDNAHKHLSEATTAEYPAPLRVRGLQRLADDHVARHQPELALAAWQSILGDPDLRASTIEKSSGLGVFAEFEAEDQIEHLLKAFPKQTSADLERQARQLVRDATGDRTEVLERLAQEYLHAAATAALLPELAQLHEKSGRWGAAARVRRLQLRLTADIAGRGEVLARLATCYEKEQTWEAARGVWSQLVQEAGDRPVPGFLAKDQTAREFVDARLKQAEYQPVASRSAPLLWSHAWQISLDAGERLLDGQSAERLPPEWITARDSKATCRESSNGKARWSVTLSASPTWCGRHLDLIVLGGPSALHGLSCADGKLIWRVSCTDDRGSFSAFRTAAGRLLCLHGENRLLAFDAATGQVLWTLQAPPGSQVLPELQTGFLPTYLATAEHVVIYTELGTVWIVDAGSGRVKHQLKPSSSAGEQGLPPQPVALQGRVVCLALDQDHIIALDCALGTELWRHKLPFRANRTGTWPLLVGSSDGLVVVSPLNFGYLAGRLDPKTGKPMWDSEHLLGSVDAAASLSVSADTIQYVRGGSLYICSLEDAHLLGRTPLPMRADGYRTAAAAQSVMAYPLPPVAEQLQFHWLLLSVQCEIEPVAPEGGFHLVTHDKKTAKQLQDLDFRPEGSRPEVTFRCDSGLCWQPRLAEQPVPNTAGPKVCAFVDGLIITVGNHAWRLNPKPQ